MAPQKAADTIPKSAVIPHFDNERIMTGTQIDLSDNVVLICGGGGTGIGAATTRAVAATGALIAVIEQSQDLADGIVSEMTSQGRRCVGFVADLLDPKSAGIIQQVVKDHGRLDAIVNVAGGTRPHQWLRLEDTSDAIFREV